MTKKKHIDIPYHRYSIEVKKTPNLIYHPHRFKVKVNRFELAKLLIKEVFHYRTKLKVVSSRPCVYGVFSGPVGGFLPREKLCVGCLRCMTEHPKVVKILPNLERNNLGDRYFKPEQVDTIIYESETGRIPIKGAGYRGTFGGTGWDGMWTDLSEIVRPTRDGIHGREFISTGVDLGTKPAYVELDEYNKPIGVIPQIVEIPLPIIFDRLPEKNIQNRILCNILNETAKDLQTFAIFPYMALEKNLIRASHIIPLLSTEQYKKFKEWNWNPLFIEIQAWDEKVYRDILRNFPNTQLILRTNFEDEALLSYYRSGIRIFHLTVDYHGKGGNGGFILGLIRQAHLLFKNAGLRDQVTLIGSGGIIAAEHLPKAILCGLDLIALDTPLYVALQAKFTKNSQDPILAYFKMPRKLDVNWGHQRIKNLVSAWRDQLLEVMGAMGIREVRRLRGEMGRAMFQKDLEAEAFQGIFGYE